MLVLFATATHWRPALLVEHLEHDQVVIEYVRCGVQAIVPVDRIAAFHEELLDQECIGWELEPASERIIIWQ